MTLIEFMKDQNDKGTFLTLSLKPLPEKGWRYSLMDGGAIASHEGTKLTATHDSIPGAKRGLEELIEEMTK